MHTTRRSALPSPPPPARTGSARRGLGLLLLSIFLVGQGCYSYHVVELQGLTPGDRIRVELDHPPPVEGTFSSLTADSLVVSVWIGQGQTGTPLARAHEDIFIPRGAVESVAGRRLSHGRTALFAGGIVAAFALLFTSIGIDVFGSGGSTSPPSPSPAIVGH